MNVGSALSVRAVRAVRAVRRVLRVARQLARIGVVRKSQFRVELASQVIMDCVWYATHLLVFEVLFHHADDVAGWSREDVRVFLGFLFVSDAFMMMWLGQSWRFPRDLKDGRLDPFRVRPLSPVFLYFFQLFSLEAVLNLVIAGAYLAWGLGRAGVALGPVSLLVVAWAIVLSCWARLVTLIGWSILDVVLVGSDLGRAVHDVFEAAKDRPLDVFGARTRLFLLYVVPVGVMTHAPARMALGRVGLAQAAFDTVWLLALGVLVLRLWTASFRRYESALG